jgi:hypothetical protein
MIINLNNDKYEDEKGESYNDTPNRQLVAALLNNYFGDNNCHIYIDKRMNEYDLTMYCYYGKINIDVKGCYIPSTTQMAIGFNKTDYDKFNLKSNEEKKNIRIAMIYKDRVCIYPIFYSGWKYNEFSKPVNDKVSGYGIKDLVQLNNNRPTIEIPYYIPTLMNVTEDENGVVQIKGIRQ